MSENKKEPGTPSSFVLLKPFHPTSSTPCYPRLGQRLGQDSNPDTRTLILGNAKTPCNRWLQGVSDFRLRAVGAGGRTRTGTPSLAVDFESTTSTNSITPACRRSKLHYARFPACGKAHRRSVAPPLQTKPTSPGFRLVYGGFEQTTLRSQPYRLQKQSPKVIIPHLRARCKSQAQSFLPKICVGVPRQNRDADGPISAKSPDCSTPVRRTKTARPHRAQSSHTLSKPAPQDTANLPA